MKLRKHLFAKKENFLEGLNQLMKENNYQEIILISAIGSLEEVGLKVSDSLSENPEIIKFELEGPFEIVSIAGNVKMTAAGEYHTHIHISGALNDGAVQGGSLYKGRVFRGGHGLQLMYTGES